MTDLINLKINGFCILQNLFNLEQIEYAKKIVIDNLNLFKNTRPYSSSRHLAGFHRYPQLNILHSMLSSNCDIYNIISRKLDGSNLVFIGLSDITLNRSQEWHCDLLRGSFSKYLNEDICWGTQGGGVFKVLLYLQDSNSLAVVPGSHLNKILLDDDKFSIPQNPDCISFVNVTKGDVVIMDIRLIHRGSSNNEMHSLNLVNNQKILISTTLGGDDYPLTKAMEIGNFFRLKAWIDKYK
jgi:hypothetical protein